MPTPRPSGITSAEMPMIKDISSLLHGASVAPVEVPHEPTTTAAEIPRPLRTKTQSILDNLTSRNANQQKSDAGYGVRIPPEATDAFNVTDRSGQQPEEMDETTSPESDANASAGRWDRVSSFEQPDWTSVPPLGQFEETDEMASIDSAEGLDGLKSFLKNPFHTRAKKTPATSVPSHEVTSNVRTHHHRQSLFDPAKAVPLPRPPLRSNNGRMASVAGHEVTNDVRTHHHQQSLFDPAKAVPLPRPPLRSNNGRVAPVPGHEVTSNVQTHHHQQSLFDPAKAVPLPRPPLRLNNGRVTPVPGHEVTKDVRIHHHQQRPFDRAKAVPLPRPPGASNDGQVSTARRGTGWPLERPNLQTIVPAPVQMERTQMTSADLIRSVIPTAGPVINTDGAINKANLSNFVVCIEALVRGLPFNSNARLTDLHHKILARFEQIIHLTSDTSALATDAKKNHIEKAEELGLAIRDNFAAAAKYARKLSRHVSGPSQVGFSILASLLTELKRTHLTAAAPAIMHNHVERVVKDMEHNAHGISQKQSGSTISTSASIGLQHTMGPPGLHAGGAKATLSKGRTFTIDDDRETDFWESYGAAIKAGGPTAWIWQAAVELGLSGGGVYFEKVELADVLRLVANYDANRSWQKSAGPFSRNGHAGVTQFFNRIKKFCLGEMHQQDSRAPNYLNDRKLAKGFNFAKMHFLAAVIDRELSGAGGHFSALIEKTYPTTASRLRAQMASGIVDLKGPLTETVPITEPKGYGKVPFRLINVDASVGNAWTDVVAKTPWVGAVGQFSAGVSYSTMQFHLQNVVAGHELLDSGYYKDIAQTFILHKQLDTLADNPAGIPSKLHLYRSVRSHLESAPVEPVDDFYDKDGNIPQQFRGAIAAPDTEQLKRITAVLNDLGAIYEDFAENAAKIMAKPDKLLPGALHPDLRELRTGAYQAINRSIWNGGYPDGVKAALNNPKKFVSQSYDAMSLGLGCAGTHLAVIKRQMALTPALHTEDNRQQIQLADRRYHLVRTLFDNIYLPIKKETVHGKSILIDRAVWQRHNFVAKFAGGGGLAFNGLEAIVKAGGESLDLGGTKGAFSVASGALGKAVVKVQYRYQVADKQVNPGRLGHFMEITLTGEGSNPVTGLAVQHAIQKVLESMFPGTKSLEHKEHLGEESFRQLQGMLWTNAPRGMSVVIKMRRFPGTRHSFDLQYVRGLLNKNSGIDFTVPIPTPIGTFSLNVATNDLSQTPLFETMGPDLGYLMLQHPKLIEVIDAARVRVMEGADPTSALKEALNARQEVKNAYFGTANLIPTVLDRYLAYADASNQAKAAGAKSPPNEFFRYNEQEPFKRIARVANENKYFKAGSTINDDPTKPQKDPFAAVPDNLHRRVPNMLTPEVWATERAHIATLGTVDQRRDYYTSERGRPGFDAFIEILSTTRAINAAAMLHVDQRETGFSTSLAKKQNATIKTIAKNTKKGIGKAVKNTKKSITKTAGNIVKAVSHPIAKLKKRD